MKVFHVLYGKKPVPLFIFLLLVFSLLSLLNVNVKVVSAVDFPSIIMEPALSNTTLTLGTNFTISIKTDYNGTDVFSWGLTLTYNPLVLQGVTITNGDLITKDKHLTAEFKPGTFDNTKGKLGITAAGFFGDTDPSNGVDVTSGPGTLTNVTFTVAGYGATNITFGRGSSETFLQGWNATDSPGYLYGQPYFIIDAKTMPDNIEDSYLINVQNLHTVGVPRIAAPSEVVVEHVADINVTVVNGGNYTENGNVTLYYNMTEIGTEPFTTLKSGEFETVSFSWNTSGLDEGVYVLNATATISGVDEYPSDNWNTTIIQLKKVHDVAVLNISAPTEADVGELIAINVTIANNGSFEESVNVTLTYDTLLIDPTLMAFQIKNISAADSALVQFNWDAAGLETLSDYVLNATATISENDIYPDDNTKTTLIELVKGHDVAVRRIEVTSPLFVGESASINVTVQNSGLYTEDSVNVTLSYKSALINTTLIGFQVENISKWDEVVVQFSWNTSGLDPDLYVLNATATISGDGNPRDNTLTESIKVQGGRITGVVTDALTGNPIEAASIIAGDYSAVTDINGTYNITDVLPGAYYVTVSATGYKNASKLGITVIAESEPTIVNFALRIISNITISADPTTISVGQNTNISGSLSPALDGVTITIQYRLSNAETWTNLTTTTTENGNYSYIWTPQTAGTYEVKASWLGDENTSSAENSVQVTVEEVPSDIFLYLAIGAAVAGVSGLAIAVYLLKIRKPP